MHITGAAAQKAHDLTVGPENGYYHECEQVLLGSMLVNITHIPVATKLVGPEHFGRAAHRELYRAILRVTAERDWAFDTDWQFITTVSEDSFEFTTAVLTDLRSRGKFKDAGGALLVAELHDIGIYTCNIQMIAAEIIEAWQNRQLASAVEDVKQNVGPEQRARALQDRIGDILAATPVRGTKGAQDLNRDFQHWLDAEPPPHSLVRTYTQLDGRIGDLMPGYYTALAARASSGKTTFLMQTAMRNALCGVPTLVLSLEMKPRQVWGRLICSLAGVESIALLRDRGRKLPAEAWDSIATAQAALHNVSLYVPDAQRGISMDRVQSICDAHIREYGVRFIAIDHMRLIRAEGRTEYEQQTWRSNRLADLARELDVPMLVAVQVNREGGKAERPALHHLEGSGAIEQDAETVLLLHAASPDSGEDRSWIQAIVAKARDGRTGTKTLPWQPQFYRIDYDHFANMQMEAPYEA